MPAAKKHSAHNRRFVASEPARRNAATMQMAPTVTRAPSVSITPRTWVFVKPMTRQPKPCRSKFSLVPILTSRLNNVQADPANTPAYLGPYHRFAPPEYSTDVWSETIGFSHSVMAVSSDLRTARRWRLWRGGIFRHRADSAAGVVPGTPYLSPPALMRTYVKVSPELPSELPGSAIVPRQPAPPAARRPSSRRGAGPSSPGESSRRPQVVPGTPYLSPAALIRS